MIRINQGGTCPRGHAESNVRKYPLDDGSFVRLTGRERFDLLSTFGTDCMICGVDISDDPHLDHCHSTGEFRGVLCRECNLGIGMFEDDLDKLHGAIEYLLKTNANKIKVR